MKAMKINKELNKNGMIWVTVKIGDIFFNMRFADDDTENDGIEELQWIECWTNDGELNLRKFKRPNGEHRFFYETKDEDVALWGNPKDKRNDRIFSLHEEEIATVEAWEIEKELGEGKQARRPARRL